MGGSEWAISFACQLAFNGMSSHSLGITRLANHPQPRNWVERMAPVAYFKRYDYGGHWPAVTHPDLWASDVREFFSML